MPAFIERARRVVAEAGKGDPVECHRGTSVRTSQRSRLAATPDAETWRDLPIRGIDCLSAISLPATKIGEFSYLLNLARPLQCN